MSYWEWNASYELGIRVVDNQHKRIIEYINELHSVLKLNDREKVLSVIIGIADYTVSHFAFEESLMKEAGYAMLEPHKKVHEAFIETVEKYKTSFRDGNDVSGQLMAELQIWLMHHILSDDKDYVGNVKKMLENREKSANITKNAQSKSWWSKLFG
jgi:hemerythrin